MTFEGDCLASPESSRARWQGFQVKGKVSPSVTLWYPWEYREIAGRMKHHESEKMQRTARTVVAVGFTGRSLKGKDVWTSCPASPLSNPNVRKEGPGSLWCPAIVPEAATV